MFDVVNLLGRGLDGAALRQNVLHHNLANANTPGYKRFDVDFLSGLRPETEAAKLPLWRTHPLHRAAHGANSNLSPHVYRENTTTMRNDGNNVDMDREMVLVMENQLHYQAMADVLNRKMSQLRSVIGEGRR